ncbi:putative F-box/LRR-repeat protein [Rosa sericea]
MEDDADRISQLPEAIMEKILFLLPAMDAIRMSFSSKTWQSLWNSMPVSNFDFLTDPAFGHYRYSSYVPCYYERSTVKKLIAKIDESLKILEEDEEQHQKRIIESFRVRGTLFRNDYEAFQCLNPWIKLVTNNPIKVLELHFKAMHRIKLCRWPFPYSLGVDGTSLVVLRLSHCQLEPPIQGILESQIIASKDKRFPSLKEISLLRVKFIGSLVDELLSRCPSLQTLKLHHCLNLKSLRICGAMFPKLNTVSLVLGETLDYKIELPNLHTLCMEFVPPRYDELGEVFCSNVKNLSVCAPPNEVISTNQFLEKLISKFPLLEDLTLSATFDSAETKISSHQLKKLTIIANAGIENHYGYIWELNLDTPNLLCFLCKNCGARNISLNSTKLGVVNLEIKIGSHVQIGPCVYHLGTPWFLGLQQCLRNFTPHDALNVTIKPLNSVAFSLEELRGDFLPLPEVQHLCLEDIPMLSNRPAALDYTNLIDGLLWSFHPVTLSVHVILGNSPNNNLIKFIYEKLICREENPLCCRENHVKCWRHYLKSIEIQSFTKGQNSYGRELSSLLANLEEVEEVSFELQWLSNN